MSTLIEVTPDLREEIDSAIACGGVIALRIPPCGQPAVVVLDRRHGHGAVHPEGAADFKCMDCYAKWRAAIKLALDAGGFIACRKCGQLFHAIDDFARYVPI